MLVLKEGRRCGAREADRMRHNQHYFPIWWTVITVGVTLAMAAQTVVDRLMNYLIEF